MRSPNRGIPLLLALGLAGGIGFAIYYYKVLVPGSAREGARAQVQEWADEHWRPLRNCLIGAAPRAAGGRDALLLRAALTTGTLPDSKDCARFFVDLRRPGKASSGSQDIELGWRALEGKTSVLANAYLDVDFDKLASIKKVGDGIDAVDAAYAALRETAGMEPDPVYGPGPFAAVPAGTPLAGTEEMLLGQLVVAGDVVLAQAVRSDDTVAWVTIRSPTALEIEGSPTGNVRLAAADEPWGLWLDVSPKGDGTVSAGAVDAAQAPVRPGTVLATARAGAGVVAPVFAFGHGPVRVATYEVNAGVGPTLWVARSLDGGATFAERREVSGDEAGIAFRLSHSQRRFDLFWRNSTGILWLGLGADDAAAPLQPRPAFPLPLADPDRIRTCHVGAADWLLLDGNVARAVPAAPVAAIGKVDRDVELRACDAAHLVLGQPERNELLVCDPTGCKTGLRARPGPGSNLVTAWGAKRGLLAATTSGDLLILWRGAEPEIMRLPGADRTLHAVVEWNGVVHLIFEIVERGLEVVRLP